MAKLFWQIPVEYFNLGRQDWLLLTSLGCL